jgi:hypothetical protein
MQAIKLTLIAALVGVASTAAFADDSTADQARRDRMDSAYNDYRNPNPGPAARGESSIKRGWHRTENAVKRDAKKVGHAIGKGVHKTGEAIDHGGEKLENASKPKQ